MISYRASSQENAYLPTAPQTLHRIYRLRVSDLKKKGEALFLMDACQLMNIDGTTESEINILQPPI